MLIIYHPPLVELAGSAAAKLRATSSATSPQWIIVRAWWSPP